MAVLLSRTVFVHTPKTAGQWTASALERACDVQGTLGPVHASPDELVGAPEWRDRPHRITFVRHPLSWYASMWAHRMDESWTPIDDLDWFSEAWVERWAEFTAKTKNRSFAAFVRDALDAFPDGWVTRLYRAYTTGCTGVGRQEDLIGELSRLLHNAGERLDIAALERTPERNTRASTPERRRQSIVSRDLAAEVETVEHWVMDTFGYDGPPPWVVRLWTAP